MNDLSRMPLHTPKDGRRLYLLALEVAPMLVGKTYNPLPSHLTLMHRFWSELSPEKLAQAIEPVLRRTQPLELLFGKTRLNGPQKVRVNMVQLTPDLQSLHMRLFDLLNTLHVTYTAPEWVGKGFAPHVTERKEIEFAIGHVQVTNAAYLIEVEIHGEEQVRRIRARFNLTA